MEKTIGAKQVERQILFHRLAGIEELPVVGNPAQCGVAPDEIVGGIFRRKVRHGLKRKRRDFQDNSRPDKGLRSPSTSFST